MMQLLGRTSYKGKEYSIIDVKKFLTTKDLGLDTNYYGGRIKRIGTTEFKGVYLLLDIYSEVFNILVNEDELVVLKNQKGEVIDDKTEVPLPFEPEPDYETEELLKLTNAALKSILDSEKISYDDKAVKKELVALIVENYNE